MAISTYSFDDLLNLLPHMRRSPIICLCSSKTDRIFEGSWQQVLFGGLLFSVAILKITLLKLNDIMKAVNFRIVGSQE